MVRPLGEDDRLAARDGARPEDAGDRLLDQGDEVRDGAREAGKVPLPFPPHVAEGVKEARALYDLVKEQGRDGAHGIVQGERALAPPRARVGHGDEGQPPSRASRSDPGKEAREEGRVLQGLPGVALGEGARHLDPGARAEGRLELVELESVTCCGAGDIHEAEPDYYLHLNARILSYAEATGCDTLMTVCNVCTLNLRQANFQLVGDAALRARVNENLASVGAPAYEGRVDVQHLLWLVAEGEGYELLKAAAHKGLKGLKIAPFYGCQILRPSKLLGFEDPDQPVVARADHRGVRRGGGRLSREAEVLRLPDHPGPGGHCARGAGSADPAGEVRPARTRW